MKIVGYIMKKIVRQDGFMYDNLYLDKNHNAQTI